MTATTTRPQPRRWRATALVVLAVLAGALALLATQRFGGPPTQMGQLDAMPEADLLYPGSEVIADGGGDAEMSIVGPQTAFVWQYVGVDASPAEIEAWYATQLVERGWSEGGGSSGINSVEELVARAWHKGPVIFRLGIQDPGYWGAEPDLFGRYQSVYDARLLGDREAGR